MTENQLHDFLINSRYSCKKCCLHNSTLLGITITVDPGIKFGLRKGNCFCHFPEFFFSSIGVISPVDPLHQKYQKPDIGSCQTTKIDTFLGQIPSKSDPHLLPDFSGNPNFFSQDFDNRYQGRHNTKI